LLPKLIITVALPFCNRDLNSQKPSPLDDLLNPKTLGEHLKKKRLESGLLQREVAQSLGVSEMTIVAWEKNHASPAIQYIPRIIAFLGYLPYPNIHEKPIGEKILLCQQLRGISQEALAKELGINPTTLRRWCRGKGWPKTEMIDELLSLFVK